MKKVSLLMTKMWFHCDNVWELIVSISFINEDKWHFNNKFLESLKFYFINSVFLICSNNKDNVTWLLWRSNFLGSDLSPIKKDYSKGSLYSTTWPTPITTYPPRSINCAGLYLSSVTFLYITLKYSSVPKS